MNLIINRLTVVIFLVLLMIFSCSKNSNKEKELELREREIAIKEIELGIKSKLSNQLEIEGTVQKFSPRGYIFKSYEGILIFK